MARQTVQGKDTHFKVRNPTLAFERRDASEGAVEVRRFPIVNPDWTRNDVINCPHEVYEMWSCTGFARASDQLRFKSLRNGEKHVGRLLGWILD